jgi:hypothetical protein
MHGPFNKPWKMMGHDAGLVFEGVKFIHVMNLGKSGRLVFHQLADGYIALW